MIPVDMPLSDALIRAHLDLHTRFPVCSTESDPQTIQGYITFKDLVVALKMEAASPSVRGIVSSINRGFNGGGRRNRGYEAKPSAVAGYA